jgi:hypothetical protein
MATGARGRAGNLRRKTPVMLLCVVWVVGVGLMAQDLR